jgi:hypothetical protein
MTGPASPAGPTDTAADSNTPRAAAATAGTAAGPTAAATNPAMDAGTIGPVPPGTVCTLLWKSKIPAALHGGQPVESEQIIGTVRWRVVVRGRPTSGSQDVDAIRDERRIDCDVVDHRSAVAAVSARQSRQAAPVSAAPASRATRLSTAPARQSRKAASVSAASGLAGLGERDEQTDTVAGAKRRRSSDAGRLPIFTKELYAIAPEWVGVATCHEVGPGQTARRTSRSAATASRKTRSAGAVARFL